MNGWLIHLGAEWVKLLLIAVVAFLAKVISSAIKRLLKKTQELTYDVTLASGKRHEITVKKAEGDSLDVRTQRVIFEALNLMRPSDVNPVSAEELKRFAAELERQRTADPLSRTIVLLLGRAYRNLGELQRAVDLLTEFIGGKEKAGQLDLGLSDAYYNRACYLALLNRTAEAVEDLKKAISLRPEKAEMAAKDADFDSIRHEIEQLTSVGAASS
jgi:tetratricopeptide (TPR) repeat protein